MTALRQPQRLVAEGGVGGQRAAEPGAEQRGDRRAGRPPDEHAEQQRPDHVDGERAPGKRRVVPGLHRPVGEVTQRRADGRAQGDEQHGHRAARRLSSDAVTASPSRDRDECPEHRRRQVRQRGARRARDQRLLDVDRVGGERGEPAEHPDPEERASQGVPTAEVPEHRHQHADQQAAGRVDGERRPTEAGRRVRGGVLQAGPGQRTEHPAGRDRGEDRRGAHGQLAAVGGDAQVDVGVGTRLGWLWHGSSA